MKKIVINRSDEQFFVSHEPFIRLRELGQAEALQEIDRGAIGRSRQAHRNRV